VIPRDIEPNEKLIRVPIAFPEELYEWMREAAHRRRVSMAELVREALREYRERNETQTELWARRENASR
jgi:Arc/MetJ-type ribon-helix-helix transcriptional regulator